MASPATQSARRTRRSTSSSTLFARRAPASRRGCRIGVVKGPTWASGPSADFGLGAFDLGLRQPSPDVFVLIEQPHEPVGVDAGQPFLFRDRLADLGTLDAEARYQAIRGPGSVNASPPSTNSIRRRRSSRSPSQSAGHVCAMSGRRSVTLVGHEVDGQWHPTPRERSHVRTTAGPGAGHDTSRPVPLVSPTATRTPPLKAGS